MVLKNRVLKNVPFGVKDLFNESLLKKLLLAKGAGFCLMLGTKILAVLLGWGQPQIYDFPIKMT